MDVVVHMISMKLVFNGCGSTYIFSFTEGKKEYAEYAIMKHDL